jgi:hypothetical protein
VFNFSLNAAGELCQIGDAGRLYTFLSNQPVPAFSGAAGLACENDAAAAAVGTTSLWGFAKCTACKWAADAVRARVLRLRLSHSVC